MLYFPRFRKKGIFFHGLLYITRTFFAFVRQPGRRYPGQPNRKYRKEKQLLCRLTLYTLS